MGNNYFFAGDIRPALESGELKIRVPEGAKLSPSALDLIRDYGAEVIFIDQADPGDETAEAEAPPSETKPASREADQGGGPGNSSLRKTVAEEISGSASDADVEEILERVMARLEKATGRTFEASAGPVSDPSPRDDDDLIICRCEEITKGQIRAAIAAGMCTLNGVKRVTRAGMGLCQGQTCQRLVTQILCQELKLTPDLVEPTTARPPTRPIPLDLLATG